MGVLTAQAVCDRKMCAAMKLQRSGEHNAN
jgi:hypothetical protein